MLRRVNFYSICFVFGLSVLLILSGSRYADNTYYRSSIENRRNVRKLLKVDYGVKNYTQQIPTAPASSPEIKNLLEITRYEIKYRLNKYNFSETGAHGLEDLVMESGGRPLHSLIISTWRSGTTFLGEILNAMPGSYFHYEPLHMYGVIQIRGPPVSDQALSTIISLLKCNYEGLENYLKHGRRHFFQLRYNTRLWNICKGTEELCYDAKFTSQLCKLFPFQVMKILRLRLRLIKEILDDEELNMKVILLIRDPRGVMNSRHHVTFCRPDRDCWEPSLVCADMISDYVAASRIQQLYPDRLMVLRYEELALKPFDTTIRILKFLRLSPTQSIYKYLQSHTNVDVAGESATSKMSQDVPFRWKKALDFNFVDEIQMACKEAMFLWGYKMAHNETHLKSKDFDPIYSMEFNPIDYGV